MNSRRRIRLVTASSTAFLVLAAVLLPAIPASASVPGLRSISGYATSTSVVLGWERPIASPKGNAYVGVVIRRALGGTAPTTATSGTAIATVSSPRSSYTDTHVHSNQEYAYAIFAKYHDGSYSSPLTDDIITYPADATHLKVTATTPTTVSLEWKNPTESGFKDTYLVRVTGSYPPERFSQVQASNFELILGKTSKTTDKFTDVGLTPGTRYSYALFAQYPIGSATAANVTTTTKSISFANAPTNGGIQLDGVSCTSSTTCAAVGGGFNAQQLSGSSWTAPVQWDNPDGIAGEVASISCASRYYCIAVNDYGDAAVYSGDAWQSSQYVDSTSPQGDRLSAVSCVKNVELCFALDSDGRVYQNYIDKWTADWIVDQNANEPLQGISCASKTFCIVTAGADHRYTFNGYEWLRSSTGLSTGGPVSCPTTSFCLELAANGQTSVYNGHGWTKENSLKLASGDQVYSVSCATSSYCMAITKDGKIAVYAGKSTASGATSRNDGEWDWSKQLKSAYVVNDVSCESTALCALVGASRPNFDAFSILARS